MLDDELVVRNVEIECSDHVVAIAECVGNIVVELVAGSFCVAHQVEPVPGPSFAVVRAGEEPVNESLIGPGLLVVQEGLDVFRRGGKAGQVER